MSLVEGVGDEIIQFLGVLLVFVLGVIAWCSTGIVDLPQIRTILILERRTQNETANETDQQTSNVQPVSNSHESQISNENSPQENSEQNSVTTELSVNQGVQGSSQNQQNNSARISEVITTTENNTDNIRIRLKYLNDDQKTVDGRLQELLGDFKKRHFSIELSRQKIIRLIFNGQIMRSDDQTLQGYGLYDNCVVHCLIHDQPNNNRTNSQIHVSNANTSAPEWNLGFLLFGDWFNRNRE